MTPAQFAVRQRLYDDFAFYAENALKIRTKSDGVVPFVLNEAQRRLLAVIERQWKKNRRVRIVILKGRQMGLSTVVGGWMFSQITQTLKTEAKKAIVVTHKAESTEALFDMTKRFYDEAPAILKPATKYSNARKLVFTNISAGYMVATAGGEGIGRGETITHAHLSELAWWPKNSARDNYNGLMEAIPNEAGTAVFIESTANGMSGLFYDQWRRAVAGESDFEPCFLPWFIEPTYTVEPPEDFERTPDEDKLVDLYGLNNGQLMFRRRKIATKGVDLFRQEYPCCAEEAFLTSGRPVFEGDRLVELHLAAKDAFKASPDADVMWEPLERKTYFAGAWEDDPRGELFVYLPYSPSETYYIGADVGGGVKRDYSVAQVFDSKRRQAAVWRSDRYDPDAFGTMLAHLGRLFNDARIICERNNQGILTNRVLTKDEGYSNYYTEKVYDKVSDTETTHVGFFTSEKSKTLIINQLRAHVRDKSISIYDYATLAELQSFSVQENGKMEAEKGCHDDCVISLALCDHINEGAFEPIESSTEWYASIA